MHARLLQHASGGAEGGSRLVRPRPDSLPQEGLFALALPSPPFAKWQSLTTRHWLEQRREYD